MMFHQAPLEKLDQYFIPLANRPEKCVYFYRIPGISPEVNEFIQKYYRAARQNGAVIDEAAIVEAGLLKKTFDGVKVLGNGELTVQLTVKAAKFSQSAVEKIEKAGGKTEVM